MNLNEEVFDVTEDEARGELARFFDAFPAYRKWFNESKRDDTTRNIWVRVIANSELDDCRYVVDQMIEGAIEIPAAYDRDRLPQIIRQHCRELKGKRRDRRRMDRLHEEANRKQPADEMERYHIARKQSQRSAELCKAGRLTQDENEQYVAMLIEWHHNGGPMPELPGETPHGDQEASE